RNDRALALQPLLRLRDPLAARDAVALGALGEAALGRQLGLDLRFADRAGAFVAGAAALLDQADDARLLLARLVVRADGGAHGRLSLVARGVGGRDGRDES